MSIPFWLWALTAGGIALAVGLDLFVFHRRPRAMPLGSALRRSAAWIGLALAFAGVIWLLEGGGAAALYLAGYLSEKAISVENVFVFALVLRYLAVPASLQPRLLLLGLGASIVLRGGFIAAGKPLLDSLAWSTYLLGALLVATAVPIALHRTGSPHSATNPILRALRRVVPVTDEYQGSRFIGRQGGARALTPLAVALAGLLATDIVFAIDSIPAIYALTDEPFLVFSAGAFALLGIKGLYFLFSAALDRFAYLHVGLGAVLALVGTKLLIADLYKMPIAGVLGAIVAILAAATAASLLASRRARGRPAAPFPGPATRL